MYCNVTTLTWCWPRHNKRSRQSQQWKIISIREKRMNKLGWAEPHSRFLMNFPKYKSYFKLRIWDGSIQFLLRFSTFNIFRSSSIEGCLHMMHLKTFVLPSQLKSKFWVWSNQLHFWYFEVVFHLNLRHLKNLVKIGWLKKEIRHTCLQSKKQTKNCLHGASGCPHFSCDEQLKKWQIHSVHSSLFCTKEAMKQMKVI